MVCLHNTSNACEPPAGRNDLASNLASPVVIRPRPAATQICADSLTARGAALAFRAADPLVIQHGVKGHGSFLSGASAVLQV